MKRLVRSRKNRKIAGICGGIGEYFDLDPTLVRLAMIVIGLATVVFPIVIGYILAWFIIPEDSL
jgi:phage shock protein C